MKVEILYPELCNIFGDAANARYLESCLPEAQFIHTNVSEKPAFINGDTDMVYIGSMTEKSQEYAVKLLEPYKSALTDHIEDERIFLSTGNSLEIFGKYIIDENKSEIPCMGIFDTYARRNLSKRHNSWFWGKYKDMDIVGNRSQFSFSYYKDSSTTPFIEVAGGIGFNEESEFEGIAYKNFYATYLLGPLLIMNPYFTKELLGKMNAKANLKYENEAIAAFEKRLAYLKNKKDYRMGYHG